MMFLPSTNEFLERMNDSTPERLAFLHQVDRNISSALDEEFSNEAEQTLANEPVRGREMFSAVNPYAKILPHPAANTPVPAHTNTPVRTTPIPANPPRFDFVTPLLSKTNNTEEEPDYAETDEDVETEIDIHILEQNFREAEQMLFAMVPDSLSMGQPKGYRSLDIIKNRFYDYQKAVRTSMSPVTRSTKNKNMSRSDYVMTASSQVLIHILHCSANLLS
jgi:hypothetical protein